MSGPVDDSGLEVLRKAARVVGPATYALAVLGETGGFAPPSDADYFDVSYPDTVTEVYAFYSGGSPSGTLLKTVTIEYMDASKARIFRGSFT